MANIPTDHHITYQLQYRKCGKASCSTCRKTQGHGPYWYAYWREGARLRSGYVGKVHPGLKQGQAQAAAAAVANKAASKILAQEYATTPIPAATTAAR
jgi:hypothetical protein